MDSSDQRDLVVAPQVYPLVRAAHYAASDKSQATRRSYAAGFRDFANWCQRAGHTALPASIEATAAYLAQLADTNFSVSTVMQRAAAIAYAHRRAGYEPPTGSDPVKAVLAGIRRELGVRPLRKAPVTVDALTSMLDQVPATAAGRRDRALLLIGFAGAFRRSEIVSLDVEDLDEVDQGLIIHLRRSKTDQDGEGRQVPILNGARLRPIQALRDWLDAADIHSGPLFRPVSRTGVVGPGRLTDGSVARLVKRYAAAAGLAAEDFSGHSLRAGFATAALDRGADLGAVARQLGHSSLNTTRIYDRRSLFTGHAGKGLL